MGISACYSYQLVVYMRRIAGLPETPKCFATRSLSIREFTMPSDEEKETPQAGNDEKSGAANPIQLLGIILKIILKERITDEEVETICSVYWRTVKEWWSEE